MSGMQTLFLSRVHHRTRSPNPLRRVHKKTGGGNKTEKEKTIVFAHLKTASPDL